MIEHTSEISLQFEADVEHLYRLFLNLIPGFTYVREPAGYIIFNPNHDLEHPPMRFEIDEEKPGDFSVGGRGSAVLGSLLRIIRTIPEEESNDDLSS